MTTEQWDVGDFEQHNPLFRTRYGELALLGVAVLPFSIGLCYLGLRHIAGVDPWSSLPVGGACLVVSAALAAAVCVMVVEWLKYYHYETLRKSSDPLAHCVSLLGRAIEDREIVQTWIKHDTQKSWFIDRLRSLVKNGDDGLAVERLNDDEVFRLIDRWIQKAKKNRDVSVVSVTVHDISGSRESRPN